MDKSNTTKEPSMSDPPPGYLPVVVKLPTWQQCNEKKDAGLVHLTDLETFILNNEPAGTEDDEWRAHLADVLAEAINEDRWSRFIDQHEVRVDD